MSVPSLDDDPSPESDPAALPAVPAFVERLEVHGDRIAVVARGEQLTYGQLSQRVGTTAALIGSERALVLIETGNDTAALIGYLAALHGRHVALLIDRDDRERIAAVLDRFDPDVVIGGDGVPRRRHAGSRHELYPELALLLATSGSTGTPRLVRLSASALDANAAAIGTYLGITDADRAALTLPMHYCYGLSVINSNLLAGAGVALADASVLDASFWDDVREGCVTSLHGVPHSFDLFDTAGLSTMDLPHLRYVTQAGGRLAPDQVQRWTRIGRDRGWELFVMYGQTEATARMAYLPPELAETAPEAIGVPIPGGSLSVEGPDGELVYRGPNVMLGYAESGAELALGRTVHELRTGDLGRLRPDGLFEIVGRRSRFVKPFAIRTDLDGLEHLLAEHDIEAAVTGTDDRIVIAARSDGSPNLAERAVETISTVRGLPATVLTAVEVDELPRRANGKLDHPAVARLADGSPAGRAAWFDHVTALVRSRRERRPRTIREVYAATFPGQDLPDDACFIDLGGDSLTFVRVSADIERVLGHLPQGWDHTPLAQLESLPTSARPARRATIEMAVLVRALAIVLVVGEHAHLWQIVGGAHLLLALSGWTFARFVLAREQSDTPDRGSAGDHAHRRQGLPSRILRSAAGMAVPSAIWIAFRASLHNVRWIDALLVGSFLPPLVPGYWFVDDLVQILIALAALLALPALRGLERRHPFGFAAGLIVVALVGRFFPATYGTWFGVDIYSTQVVLWLFVLGWLVHRATTRAQQYATTAAILVLVPTFFGADALRSIIVVAGLLMIQYVPTLTVPRWLATTSTTIAAASLGIFLTHFGVLPLTSLGFPPIVVTAAGIVTGIVSWWLLSTVVRAVSSRLTASSATAAVPPRRPELPALAGVGTAALDTSKR
jgi:acyl-CoA synthetase (AMP-forming)/AMP-acid ligase II